MYLWRVPITEFQSIIVKMSAKLDKHDGDVDLLKKTVSNHSKEIETLKKEHNMRKDTPRNMYKASEYLFGF